MIHEVMKLNPFCAFFHVFTWAGNGINGLMDLIELMDFKTDIPFMDCKVDITSRRQYPTCTISKIKCMWRIFQERYIFIHMGQY